MNYIQQSRPLQAVSSLCPKHQEYVKGICLFNGRCTERLLCRSCRKNHDKNHLSNYEELEDLLNGNLVNDIIKEFDQLIKRMDHQVISYQKNNQDIIAQIVSLFNQIQNHIVQKMNETKNSLLEEINKKLRFNVDLKNGLILQRREIEQTYLTAVSSNFQPHYVIDDLVQVVFRSQNIKTNLVNNPQFNSLQALDLNLSLLSQSGTGSLFQYLKMSLDKISQDILKTFISKEKPLQPQGQAFDGGNLNMDTAGGLGYLRNTTPTTTFPLNKPTVPHLGVTPGYPSTSFQPNLLLQPSMFGDTSRTNLGSTGTTYNPYQGSTMMPGATGTLPPQGQPPGTSVTFKLGTTTEGIRPDQARQAEGDEAQQQTGMNVEQPQEQRKKTASPKRRQTPQKILELFQKVNEQEKGTKTSGSRDAAGGRRMYGGTNSGGRDRLSAEPRGRQSVTDAGNRSRSEGHPKADSEFIKLKTLLKTDHKQIMFGGLSYLPSKGQLVTSGLDGYLELWDINKKQRVRRFKAHDAEIFKVIFVEEKDVLLTAGSDGLINVWNCRNDLNLMTKFKKHSGPVFALEYLSDLGLIMSGGEDEHLRIWKAESGEEVHMMKTAGTRVGSICYMKRIGLVAVGFDKGHINMIQITQQSKKVRYTIKAHGSYVLNLFAVEEKDWLVSGSDDGNVKVWRIYDKKYQCLQVMSSRAMVRSFAVFPEKDLIISNHDDKHLRLWQMSTGESLKAYRDKTFGEGMVTLKNRDEIATGFDKEVKLWTIN